MRQKIRVKLCLNADHCESLSGDKYQICYTVRRFGHNLENNPMQNFPLVNWASRHPRLAAWIVLATGMVIMLVYEARDVGLLATQWLALVIATVLVAGACIWIISWEDEAEETPAESIEAEAGEPSTPADDAA
jgi:hypothetical protein